MWEQYISGEWGREFQRGLHCFYVLIIYQRVSVWERMTNWEEEDWNGAFYLSQNICVVDHVCPVPIPFPGQVYPFRICVIVGFQWLLPARFAGDLFSADRSHLPGNTEEVMPSLTPRSNLKLANDWWTQGTKTWLLSPGRTTLRFHSHSRTPHGIRLRLGFSRKPVIDNFFPGFTLLLSFAPKSFPSMKHLYQNPHLSLCS